MGRFCKRTPALTSAALLATSALNCSSDTRSQTTATPDATAQTGISNEEPKTEESKDTGEPITIRLTYYIGEQAKRDVLDAMLMAPSETHSETKVDVEVAASSSYTVTYKGYTATGEALGIMFGKPRTMQEFVDGGHSADLKDETCMVNILPMLMDERTVNGGVYDFPIGTQVKAMFYNKEVFREAGVEILATKGELLKVCDIFMGQGVHPLVHPYNPIHGVLHELDSFPISIATVIGNESVWMDSQDGIKGLSGSPAVVEEMEMFSKFVSYKDAGDMAADRTQGIQNFVAGQRPIYTNDGRLMGDVIVASPDGEFGMFSTPWSDNPGENKSWIGTDDVFAVSQQTERRDGVTTLLNFFVNEGNSKTWMSIVRLTASNITVSTDDVDAFIKEIKSHIGSDTTVSKSLVPDRTSEYSAAFRTRLQEFVTLDSSQRDVTKLLKDIDDKIAPIRQQFLEYI